jgi:Zn-dependent protease with chaperone function
VRRGRRSNLLLGGLALVAVANGLLLGLSLYGLLAAALKILHDHAPPLGYAWLVGALAGVALLGVALLRERALRQGGPGAWHAFPPDHPTAERFAALIAASSLNKPPALRWVEDPDRNAFVVGASQGEATVVLTAGLLEALQPEELDAVLAEQLAHVESQDLQAVGLADAVADSIGGLMRAKGRFLWGPRAIVADTGPFLAVLVVGIVLISALSNSADGSEGMVLFRGVVSLALIYALWVTAKRSWLGLFQLFIFVSFLGPMSLVEAALAPPTAVILSRLVSRARIHEADARAVELTGSKEGLIAALESLEEVERAPSSPWLEDRRFSLFLAAQPEDGFRAWLAHLYATHPTVSSRLETIRASTNQTPPRSPARAAAGPG